MDIDEGKTAFAAACIAAAGILILFLLSETPTSSSVAQALVANENELLKINGIAVNITGEKFLLCDRLCISIRSNQLPTSFLLEEERQATVTGRVKEYWGRRYIEAEKIDVK